MTKIQFKNCKSLRFHKAKFSVLFHLFNLDTKVRLFLERQNSIVLFTAEFPFGQQETFLENELIYLSKSFGRVTIIPLFKHSYQRKLDYKNVVVYTPVNSSRDITIHKFVLLASITFWKTLFTGVFEVKKTPKSLLKLLKQAFIISRMKKYLRKRPEIYNNDLWYFYWGTNSINILPYLKRIPKIIARYHRYDLYGEDVDGGEHQLFQKKTMAKVNMVISISEHGKEYLRSLYNEYDYKMIVSRLGVPFRGESSASSDGILRIVSCSNLYAVKRMHLLAEAFKQIEDIKIEWTHIGDGPENIKKPFLELTKILPKNIKFKFLGRIQNKQIMDYYKTHAVDLFVNVSISEGVPVSIMEAYSFGIPVLATDVGGTSEIVLGEMLLKPHFSVSELAQAIRQFHTSQFKNMELRNLVFERWKIVASADENYNDFIKILKNTYDTSSDKPKLRILEGASESKVVQ